MRLRFAHSVAATLAVSLIAPITTAQTDKLEVANEGVPDLVLPDGSRRYITTELVPISPEELVELAESGEPVEIDSATGMRIMTHVRDALPLDWDQAGAEFEGIRLDSYGNPIVNTLAGMPDWAQWNVDALRLNIADHALHIRNLELAIDKRADEITIIPMKRFASTYARDRFNLETDLYESRRDLGNLIAQAFCRDIPVGDLVDLADRTLMTDDVITSCAETVAWIDLSRAGRIEEIDYKPTELNDEALRLLALNGTTADDVHVPYEAAFEPELRGIIPILLCYAGTDFARGWTLLSGDVDIYNGGAGTFNNQSTDIPLYGEFYFFTCTDGDENNNVRVSTNGYVTFFEQGGDALDGTDFGNDPIPNNVNDPDGFIAGWWDDLIVQAQGSTDRISRLTEGSSPNRVTTIQYFSVSRNGGGGSEFYRFQIKLFEQTQNVEIHYDVTWAGDGSDSATTGMENFNGGLGSVCGFDCTNTFSADPPNNLRWRPFFRPSNDLPANASCLLPNDSVIGNTYGATGTDLSSCTFDDFADVWYIFHPSVGGNVTLTTCSTGTNYDTSLSVFENVFNGTEVACDDDDPAGGDCIVTSTGFSRKSTVTFAANSANTYFVRVSGFGGERGRFELTATGGGTPGGFGSRDDCPIAGTVSGNTASGFTDNNTGCNDQSTCGDLDYIDEWVMWTSPAYPTDALASLAGSDFNTTLNVFDACPTDGGSEIACNDDFLFSFQSLVGWEADPSTTYWLRIAGVNGAVGDWELEFIPVPKNDDCADARELLGSEGSVVGNLTNATNDAAPVCGASASNPDTWYTFTAACDGSITFDTCGTHDAPGEDLGMDTVLTLYDACGGTVLACNDDWLPCGGAGLIRDSRIRWAISEGETVLLRVSHWSGVLADGAYTLDYDFSPVNDNCADAITVVSGTHDVCNIGASTDGIASNLCVFAGQDNVVNDVWYRYVVPCNGRITVTTCNTIDWDSRIALYGGEGCANLNSRLRTCQDDEAGCGLTTVAETYALAGSVLYIRIGGYPGFDPTGSGTFDISCAPGCACDWNSDGFKNNTDFFDFVNDFFGGTGPQGQFDFNLDGFENNQDWFDFSNCFFNNLPGC